MVGVRLDTCRSKAPAKIILFGEHFVVYGVPALAAAVGLYARVVAKRATCNSSIICSTAIGVCEPTSKLDRLKHLAPIAKIMDEDNKIVALIDSDIPIGAGLGSSAAIAVALAAAVRGLVHGEIDRTLVLKDAFEVEKIVHGKPSGIDNTVSCYGGFILYSPQGILERINTRITGIKILVAYTGIRRSTRDAVERVKALRVRFMRIFSCLEEAVRNIVDEALQALTRGDVVKLGELMNINHGLLSAIGVSTPELEELVYLARKAGALGAKITGAGLGGSIIALAWEDDAKKIHNVLERKAAKVFILDLGVDGVSLECY